MLITKTTSFNHIPFFKNRENTKNITESWLNWHLFSKSTDLWEPSEIISLYTRYPSPEPPSRGLSNNAYTRSHVIIKDNVACAMLMYQTECLCPESIPFPCRQSTPAVPGRSPQF